MTAVVSLRTAKRPFVLVASHAAEGTTLAPFQTRQPNARRGCGIHGSGGHACRRTLRRGMPPWMPVFIISHYFPFLFFFILSEIEFTRHF